jgi:polar amino acid transport system substrate-binding protein
MNKSRPTPTFKGFWAFCLLLIALAPLTQASQTIKIITIDAPPWVSRSPDTGELHGAFVDVVDELANRTDYAFEITLSPFARVGRELELGVQDCTILAPLPPSLTTMGELILKQPLGVIGHSNLNIIFDKDYATGLRKLARGRVDAVAGAIPTLQYIARGAGVEAYLGAPLVLAYIPLNFQCSKKSNHLDAMGPINQAIKSMHDDGVINDIKLRHGF